MSESRTRHDVVIVGGGTAGCVLAARLTEDPHRSVLVLEAGPDLSDASGLPEPLTSSTATDRGARIASLLWEYDVELRPGGPKPPRQIRGRILGGSSSVNGPNFTRGIPEDYDGWGSPLWSFESVLPYFRKLERDQDFVNEFHGTAGPFPVWRVRPEHFGGLHRAFHHSALRAGVPQKPDLNDPRGAGIGPQPRSDLNGSRTSAAIAYLGPARSRPNLTVEAGVIASRVVIEHGRATAVEVRANGRTTRYPAEQIVLSAGAFASPQLLLTSGIGPPELLRALDITVVHGLSGVGRDLSCHPTVSIPLVDRRSEQLRAETTRLETTLVASAGSSAQRNNLAIAPRVLNGQTVIQVSLRLPDSRGHLYIGSANPAAAPLISYGYLDPADLGRLRDGIRIALAIGRDRAFVRDGFDIALPDEDILADDWILANLRTPAHACGTCRLGLADEGAVVDDRCQIHGLSGLRVIDLSIVPRSVRAGPAATVVMLAERAADLL